MDDRILFVPPVFAPDPDVLRSWASTGILIARLEERWPVDFVRWPTLKGESRAGAGWGMLVNTVRGIARPEHHVVDISFGGGSLVVALEATPPRSFCVAGFVGTLATLRDAGHPELADATQLSQSIMTRPGQFLPFIMEGASREDVEIAERQLEATLDKELLAAVFEAVADVLVVGLATLEVPSMFFVLPAPFPGGEIEYEIYRTLAPGIERADLSIWPGRLHLPDGGNELADRVIPFIHEVIAAREDA